MKRLATIILFFAISLVLGGCFELGPNDLQQKTKVTYHFDGGAQMCDLFVLNATYTGANGRSVTEFVPTLPWSKTIEVVKPFEAALNVKFKAREEVEERPLFNVGFDGAISYKKPNGEQVPLSIKTRTTHDPNKLVFSLVLPEGVSADDYSLRVAPLKFDKHFAFSPTIDDSYTSAYSRVWSLINGKWIDDKEFLHMGRPRTSGYTPERVLAMGDGCGSERRFGFSCALWPTWGNANNETFIKDLAQTADNSIYIAWEELALMSDFGVSMLYHNVDERVWDRDNVAQIEQGFLVDYQKTFRKTGVKMKILGLPDGKKSYADAGQSSDNVVMTRNSLKHQQRIFLNNSGSLYKAETYGGNNTSDIDAKLKELADQSQSSNPYWVAITQQRPKEQFLKMLETIYDLYGKAGEDNLWVASWDEVYEYVALREGSTIKKTVDGRTLTFEVSLPERQDFLFEELTFLLSGPQVATITPQSTSIVGFTHSQRGDECLINVRFGERWSALAEKYTLEYQAVPSAETLTDAQYFISALLPSLRVPFEQRIENVEIPGIDQLTPEGARRYQRQYDGFVYSKSATLKGK